MAPFSDSPIIICNNKEEHKLRLAAPNLLAEVQRLQAENKQLIDTIHGLDYGVGQ